MMLRGMVVSVGGHDSVTLDASVADVFGLTGQVLSADDAGADKLPFWDDSAGKMVYATIGAGLLMTGTTLTSGAVVQKQTTQTQTSTSGTTTIPVDNTAPLNSEGTEIFTRSITPLSASNILRITVVLNAGHGGAAWLIAALFQDSGGCLASVIGYNSTATALSSPLVLVYEMTAGTTSSTTFKVRFGSSSGTWYLHRNASNLLGGTIVSSITVEERTP